MAMTRHYGYAPRTSTRKTQNVSLWMKMSAVTRIDLLVLLLFNFVFTHVLSIDCFKCISVNKNYKPCEDPFHNNYTADIFHSPCMGGRKGRDGVFPATSCIKITGVFDETQDEIVLRGCALDSGGLTTDTELVRMSHCGGFYYDKKYVRGCVQSCSDADACNVSVTHKTNTKVDFYLYIFYFSLIFFMQI